MHSCLSGNSQSKSAVPVDEERRFGGTLTRRIFLTGLGLTAASILLPRCASVPGITVETLGNDVGTHLFVTTLPHGHYRARIVTAQDIVGETFAKTTDILEATGADVCINGSFFEADGSPSGLLIIDGEERHPHVQDKGDGILYTDEDGALDLVFMDQFMPIRDRAVEAIQINLLSMDGVTYYRKWRRDAKQVPRNFIGIRDRGIVNVIFKDTNLILGDEYMRRVHNCRVVGALDGGGSASAVSKSGISSYREELDEKREVRVPTFVLFYKKGRGEIIELVNG
ncbi:MAG: phosphodiester glycosidase family protein [Deltaproteobacteria bacterium]|nr:phosphodiester glycosidase family protein [Candidatus Zymogenaceae bacterium]